MLLFLAETEMDLIEMVVYGDVIRPGLQCRVLSKAEEAGILGSKSKKNAMMACAVSSEP